MQTELAQMISLTSYGNEFIKTGRIPEDYFPNNTVFQYCDSVDFRDFKKSLFARKPTEKITAKNPLEWFGLLRKEQCDHLRLYYQSEEKNEFGPEYNRAGFVGGAGTWLIETNFGNYSHYWHRRWQGTTNKAPGNKIWSVNYARTIGKFNPTDQHLDLQQSREAFSSTVDELIGFCIMQKLKHWQVTFENASKALTDPTPNKLFYLNDLIVTKNYSLAAQQLLFAGAIAWVFGAMGSWNDMLFSDEVLKSKYLALSQKLYEQITQSILATINSF